MSRQAGFTLLETVLAGAMASALAGSILTLLYFCNDRIEESLIRTRLASQYEIVAEAIHRMAREAYTVGGDTETFADRANPPAFANPGRITFYRKDGSVISGFEATAPDYVFKERSGAGFATFLIAGDSLRLSDFRFEILEERKAVSFRMSLRVVQDGKTFTLSNPAEIALCRNNVD